ncbi:hypothetical protein [Nocardiopsis halotolerans]|uniref:hypothetical protein n=1 Tax=Nocardiopsis halotolerans TaxID=124252 RepID=UPI000476B377|nr:hypothetical protein [Nocardiopsis halotolerans]
MSENGPYNQPPHNPYGGGDNSGGQPPYGPPQGVPYGDQGTGGQPGYGGPAGFPGPQEQQMYAGGQPPYGGGPGYPPPPPQQPQGGGKAGLWVVIGGGAVIIVLVIAVVVMLVTNGNGGQQTVAPEPGPTQGGEETTDGGGGGGEGGGEETDTETDAAPAGEPPYAVPTEPCTSFTDQVVSDFLLEDQGDKYVQEESSSCESLNGAAPEGNPEGTWGSLKISYGVPYSAADSVEAATADFQSSVQQLNGEGEYNTSYEADNVEANEELDLGDEAQYVLTKYDFLGNDIPEATVLIRTANLNIKVQYQVHPPFGEEDDSEDLVMPENIGEIMANAGAEALAAVGS